MSQGNVDVARSIYAARERGKVTRYVIDWDRERAFADLGQSEEDAHG